MNKKKVGIVYHGKMEPARDLAEKGARLLDSLGASVWLSPVTREKEIREQAQGSDFVVSIGGDGTILRVARAILSTSTPILGINLGKLGFMAELDAEEALERLPGFLTGEGWRERRAMLQAEVLPQGEGEVYHALNDIILARGRAARVIRVDVSVDGVFITTYKGDGVILATATGSTGYALAAGGPILYPQAEDILLQPLVPHMSLANALVLPSQGVLELQVRAEHETILSIDGQVDIPLSDKCRVIVKKSPYSTLFLRAQPPSYFYATLTRRLAREGG